MLFVMALENLIARRCMEDQALQTEETAWTKAPGHEREWPA